MIARKTRILNFYLKKTSILFVSKIIMFGIVDKFNFNDGWNKENSKWQRSLKALFNKETTIRTDFGTYVAYPYLSWVLNPYYEDDVRKVLLKNFEEFKDDKSKIFIDVGAHVGRYAIDIAMNNDYKVLAFEPSPATYSLLKRNIRLSKVEDKVKAYNFGLGNQDFTTHFREDGFQEGANRIIKGKKPVKGYTKVRIKRFDSSIKADPQRVKLIIIDVEGFEYDVLCGMKGLLEKTKDIDVIVEIFEKNKERQKTFALMKSLGFTASRIDRENHLFFKRKRMNRR